MTEELQTLLRARAHSAPLLAPDLATITRDGRRRVRRRRSVAAVGVLAAVAVAGVGVGVVAPRVGDDQTTSTERSVRVSWAEGQVIHDGDQTIDVARNIVTYVRTSVGFVFVDDQGGVWSVQGDDVEEVGTTWSGDPHLAADTDGVLAGWVEYGGKHLSFVVLNQDTGRVLGFAGYSTQDSRPPRLPGDGGGSMIAIDGESAYWRDADTTYETSYGSDGHFTLGVDILEPGQRLLTAHDGYAVHSDDDTGVVTAGRIDGKPQVELPGAEGDSAVLSPDHRWVSMFAVGVPTAQPQVYDTSTGDPITLDVHAPMATGYEWLDDDTLAVLSVPSDGSNFQLLTCTVPDGECAVAVADLGEGLDDGANGIGFALPSGDLYYPYPRG